MTIQKQITNDELLELTRQAFEKNEVAEFLQGMPPYVCPINRFVPANVPTDFGRIVEFGIYKLYEKKSTSTLVEQFKNAICSLLRGSATDVWIGFMISWNQIRNEIKSIAPFAFATSDYIDLLRDSLLSSKQALINCKEWQGYNEENGLWQDISRICDIAKKNYEVIVL